MAKEKNNESENDNYTWLIIIILLVILMWFGSLYLLKDKSDRGTFGDMFGAVNALFSGLAFAGLIFAIILQKKELGLQRLELRDTRLEFATQNDTLKKQRFENTFFQLINLHHVIVDHFSYYEKKQHIEKRDVIKNAGIDLIEVLKFVRKKKVDENIYHDINYVDIEITNLEDEEEYIKKAYEAFYDLYHLSFSHYFRNLYHIFKFIYTSDLINKNEKHFYASIVRAQLSPEELLLVFYNSLIEGLGFPNFLFLIKEFDILQNFDSSVIPFKNLEVFNDKINNVKNPFNNTASG